MKTPKFQIGQTVYNTISKRGSYGPGIADPFTKMEIESVKRVADDFLYTCGFEGWEFKESELLSPEEYARKILE